MHVSARHRFSLLVELFDLISQSASFFTGFVQCVYLLPESPDFQTYGVVYWITSSLLAFIESNFDLLHKLIQFMQVDVGRDRRAARPLRCPTIGSMKCPLFHVACLKHRLDQLDKSLVVDLLFQQSD